MDVDFEEVREVGQIRYSAVFVVTGITPVGERQVLGVSAFLSKHKIHCKTFLKNLKDRGMKGMRLGISDDHEDLRAARRVVLGSVPWQRSDANSTCCKTQELMCPNSP